MARNFKKLLALAALLPLTAFAQNGPPSQVFGPTPIIRLWSGACDSTHALFGDGVCRAVTGGSGTVTSVAMTLPTWLAVAGSPVTTSGTLAVTAATGQPANEFLATPNGSPGAMSLRAILAADILPIDLASTANGGIKNTLTVAHGGIGQVTLTNHGVVVGAGTSPVTSLAAMSLDTLLQGQGAADPAPVSIPNCGSSTAALAYSTSTHTFSCQTISAGTGTVTSVALTMPSVFTVGGSPVTSSGTLAVTANGTSGGVPYFDSATTLASSGALTASRLVLGGGAGAAPTVLGSLGTTTTVLHGNAAGAPSFGAVSLTTDAAGTLQAAQEPAHTGDMTNTAASLATKVVQLHPNVTTLTNASSPYAVAATDSMLTCDATAGAVVINLPAATGTNREISVKKIDSTTNACTPTRAGSDLIDGATNYSLTVQYAASKIQDTASAVWSRTHVNQMGGDLSGISTATQVLTTHLSSPLPAAQGGFVPVDVQTFTSSGTWTKPTTGTPLTTLIDCTGAGGGGGGGARVILGTAASGGGAGAGGYHSIALVKTSSLNATETVTIGAAGSAGTGATVDTTAGTAGTAGASSTFGSTVSAPGGGGGSGGQVAANSGGGGGGGSISGGGSGSGSTAGSGGSYGGQSGGSAANGNSSSAFAGAGGGGDNGTTGGAGQGGGTNSGGVGGGSGGGISTTTAAAGGASGANSYIRTQTSGGAATGAVGGNGSSPSIGPGSGGGGGGGNAAGAGGAGGTAGIGAGAGGGGVGVGGNGGAGATGGGGQCVAVTSF